MLMEKFKVGDKVRLKDNRLGYNAIAGSVAIIREIPKEKMEKYKRECWINVDWINLKEPNTQMDGAYDIDDFELEEQKDIIVHCPTQELWNRVQKKMFETTEWTGDSEKKYLDFWDDDKEESCIYIMEAKEYKMFRNTREWCKEEYPNTPIISAEEYLGEEKGFETDFPKEVFDKVKYYTKQQVNKPNKIKCMTKCALEVIKKLRLSADEKLLIEYSCIDDNKNWLEQGRDSIGELEANKRGFKSFQKMGERYNQQTYRVSMFEFDTMVKEHLSTLIENLRKDKKDKEGKNK